MIKQLFYLISIVTVLACQSEEQSQPAQNKNSRNDAVQEVVKPKSSPLDSLNNYLGKNPNDAHALVNRAKSHLKNRNLPAAAGDIMAALQIDSNLAEAHSLKGEIHYIQNQTRQARDEWIKCINLDPENTDCRMKLTEIYVAVKNYDKALEQVNAVIAYDKYAAPAFFLKGYIIRDYKRDTVTALQYFQKAIDLDQNYIDALDIMGVTLTNRKDTLARYYFERILELQPNRADIYYKLGVYYTNIDDINRALESYTKALQINPHDPESLFNLGYLYVEIREYQEAKEYFSRAILAKQRNYKAYYGRGYTFEVTGDVINARKDYQKALEILPIYEPAKKGLKRIEN